MLVGPRDDTIESKIVEITKGGLEPPEPNASYAPGMYAICNSPPTKKGNTDMISTTVLLFDTQVY